MKKIVLSLALMFFASAWHTPVANAASPADWWVGQDAEVSPYVYSYLLKDAGFTAYIHTDTKIDLSRTEHVSDINITERFPGFIVGEFRYTYHKFLITSDGLILVYYPKELAGAVSYADNFNFVPLQKLVKGFVGPTITKANYINFSSLSSNKLLTLNGYEHIFTLPVNSKVQMIAADAFQKPLNHRDYVELPSKSVLPGISNVVTLKNAGGLYIDNIEVSGQTARSLNVFYQGDSYPIVSGEGATYETYDLENKFLPIIKDMTRHGALEEVRWAVKQGLVQGYQDGSFKPENTLTESQFVSIFTKYYNINTSLDGKSNSFNIDGAYIALKKYNFPLKGYKDKAARNKQITRGTVAQILSSSQGGPTDVKGAYQFLAKHHLTNSPSFEAYNAAGGLKRSHISSFFKRMDAANLTELK